MRVLLNHFTHALFRRFNFARILSQLVCSLILVSGLFACAVDPVPELTYYPLAKGSANSARETLLVSTPIVVDTFISNGVYGSQAILYANKPDGSLRAYHYQLWADPPVKLLQSRLIKRLREANVAALITDRLGASEAALRISGRIENFERVQNGSAWHARVAVELRVEQQRNSAPILLRTYAFESVSESDTMQANNHAFAIAVDHIYAEFLRDVELTLSAK